MLIGYLAGRLIGIAFISAVSALLAKLAIRLLYKQKVTFARTFLISFVSVLAALLVQIFFDDVRAGNTYLEVLPGLVFFLTCWMLNVQFIEYGENNARSYGKNFLVTMVHCVALFTVGMIFSLVLLAGLSSVASSVK